MSIEVSQRRAVFSEIGDYCMHSKESDYIEVTQWSNGEGFDVAIARVRGTETFSVTYGEWELLQVLMNWKGD